MDLGDVTLRGGCEGVTTEAAGLVHCFWWMLGGCGYEWVSA